jgi:hypothetical protein
VLDARPRRAEDRADVCLALTSQLTVPNHYQRFPTMPSHLNDILLGTGLLSSGYWLLGNLACSLIGVVPAVLADDHAASLSPVQRVKLWQWFYDKAKVRPTSFPIGLSRL